MISKIKKLAAFCIAAFVMVTLVSCGGTGSSGGSNEDKSKVDIKDIAWNIDTSVIDGERCVAFEYTNNSKYTITDLQMSFVEKDDVTEEQLNAFYEDVIEEFELSDEDQAELKKSEVKMTAESERIVKAGETASNIELNYYEGYYDVKDINHCDLVEPDIATYSYIDDNQIYTVSYDFKADKYTMDTNIEMAVFWPGSDLGTMIPQPEAEVVKDVIDSGEEGFVVEAYGISRDMLNDYTAKCKKKGFTVDADSYDGDYMASNEEGYTLTILYYEYNMSMEISLDPPSAEDAGDE